MKKVFTVRGFIPGLKLKEKGRNSYFSKAFKTYKEWWDKTKKPKIAEKAKTSILQKLRESQAIVDQRKEQQSPNLNRNKLRSER